MSERQECISYAKQFDIAILPQYGRVSRFCAGASNVTRTDKLVNEFAMKMI